MLTYMMYKLERKYPGNKALPKDTYCLIFDIVLIGYFVLLSWNL